MLACKSIFTTPSIDIRSRKTARESKTRRNFVYQNSTYVNYTKNLLHFQVNST